MREFLEALPCGAVVADVGCGNGKYFGVRPDIALLGSDRSSGLAAAARARLTSAGVAVAAAAAADVAVADGLHLPYRDACCDAAMSIAVLHHIASPARRIRLMQELLRILRPGAFLAA